MFVISIYCAPCPAALLQVLDGGWPEGCRQGHQRVQGGELARGRHCTGVFEARSQPGDPRCGAEAAPAATADLVKSPLCDGCAAPPAVALGRCRLATAVPCRQPLLWEDGCSAPRAGGLPAARSCQLACARPLCPRGGRRSRTMRAAWSKNESKRHRDCESENESEREGEKKRERERE